MQLEPSAVDRVCEDLIMAVLEALSREHSRLVQDIFFCATMSVGRQTHPIPH